MEQPVFWRPDADPQCVILAAAPAAVAATAVFSPDDWSGEVVEHVAANVRHLRISTAAGDHCLCAPLDLRPGDPITSVIPMSDDAAIRAEAALRFWRCISGAPCQGEARVADLRTKRVRLSLRALDARQAGASYRSLAEALHGPGCSRTDDWKTSSLRDTTIRLVRCGVALMNSDYRRLLRRKPIG